LANAIAPRTVLCALLGRRARHAGDVAEHVVAHGGDWNRFLLGELQSLCASCHSGGKQFEEVHGYYPDIGLDGFPLDPGIRSIAVAKSGCAREERQRTAWTGRK
jgi:hypothetical protein